jgi:hypothetical protein
MCSQIRYLALAKIESIESIGWITTAIDEALRKAKKAILGLKPA